MTRISMQEQLSEVVKQNTIAIYKINFSTDAFEQYIALGEHSVKVEKGDQYETTIFRSANTMLNSNDRLRFLETFSLGKVLKSHQDGKHELTLDYESIQPGGATIWLRSILRFYLDGNGILKGYLYVVDIDKQKKAELEMLHRAETDSMTGLLNKEVTQKKIDALCRQADSSKNSAFLMIDLDCFKQINDTYGHSEGDRVIKEVAAVLKRNSRPEVLSEEVLCQRSEKICEKIRQIALDGMGDLLVSCSIGIAFCSGEKGFEELYKKADIALYIRKKEQGRDGYTFYKW